MTKFEFHRWRQYAPLKRRSTPTRLHGAISQKVLILRVLFFVLVHYRSPPRRCLWLDLGGFLWRMAHTCSFEERNGISDLEPGMASSFQTKIKNYIIVFGSRYACLTFCCSSFSRNDYFSFLIYFAIILWSLSVFLVSISKACSHKDDVVELRVRERNTDHSYYKSVSQRDARSCCHSSRPHNSMSLGGP
jgi:hypothetical protein